MKAEGTRLEFASMGKILIAVGVAIALTGLAIVLLGRLPGVGRVPGDILIRRDGIVFYFPIISCLILSLILTIVANLIARFVR